ncbi:hypothetical protein IHMA87_03244 [Pseudomonas paraeruginosa]|nr:hypothetical protein IHMA87_03244 [Pseudomonas aeruginosa]
MNHDFSPAQDIDLSGLIHGFRPGEPGREVDSALACLRQARDPDVFLSAG